VIELDRMGHLNPCADGCRLGFIDGDDHHLRRICDGLLTQAIKAPRSARS
jgi:hypothetical protein